jgi:membrane protein
VKEQRAWSRKITDYISFFFLAPIAIVLTSGVTIFLTTIAKQMEGYMLLGSAVRFFISLMPYVIMAAVFISLYVFLPNTRVKLKNAIVPGILAGVAMHLLQLFYIYSQIWVTGYNAIYGSFAALPLFMLWMQISWTICLFGAQLTYTNQNLNRYGINLEPIDIHPKIDMSDDERDEAATQLYSDRLDSL